jgi:hypothetical protein
MHRSREYRVMTDYLGTLQAEEEALKARLEFLRGMRYWPAAEDKQIGLKLADIQDAIRHELQYYNFK